MTPHDAPDRTIVGYLSVVDNTVDVATGGIKLKATFDNKDGLLWPGQFVNVVLTLDTIQNATVIPSEAVQNGQKGSFVYVVKKDQTVEPRVIEAGRVFGSKTVVQSGLAPGRHRRHGWSFAPLSGREDPCRGSEQAGGRASHEPLAHIH